MNPNFDPARLTAFLDTRDDTDTGDYELFLYRFATANSVDGGDSIQGGAGDDTIKGGMGADALDGGPGVDVIDVGDGTAPVPAPASVTVNEVDSVSVSLPTSSSQLVSWRVAASNSQEVSDGSGPSFSFVTNDSGIYTLTYTILGSEGDTSSDTIDVTVLNVAPTAVMTNGGAVSEGQTGSVSLSGQADPSASDLSSLRYSYDFNNDGIFDLGDGSYLGGVTTTNATVPAAYLNNGPFNRIVGARVIDKDGGFTDYSTTIAVSNVTPTVVIGGDVGLSTPTLSRSGSFSDPGADSWTATVNYGDGSGTQALSFNADKTFTLLHSYSESGVYAVTVTVNDGTATGSASFQVFNSLPAAIEAGPDQGANEGSVVSLMEATFSNPYSTGMHTATINWGDGTAVDNAGISQSGSGSGVVGIISGSHRYADNGTYTVTVTVTTPYGTTSSDSFTVTINNVAPTLAPLSGPAMVIPGQPLAYSATFADPGFDNSLNAGEVAETFTGAINWGDATPTEPAAVTWTTGSPGVVSSGSATKGHIYSTPGTYAITLTLNDDDTGSATRTLVVTVTESAYLLATGGSEVLSVSGNGRVALPGVIDVNSNSATAIRASGNAQVSASQILVVGGFNRSGNAVFSTSPTTGVPVAVDPLASLTAPSASGGTGSVNLSGHSSLTISPGRYSQIKVAGNAILTMLPGVYVIVGGGISVTGGGSITGHGVMIYNAGSNYPNSGGNFGGIAVTGTGTIDLTAPSTGDSYAGVLFFQSRDNTRALALSGNGLVGIRGTIYARAAQVALSGNAELKASLVVQSLTVSGNAVSSLLVDGDLGTDGLAQTLLGADLWVYVDNSDGAFRADALARIDSTVAGLNALLGSHGVFINLVGTLDDANLVIEAAPDSPLGGVDQGVLGFYANADERSEITLIQGWDWYEGADPAGIGQSQFDFQTIVTHELGHAVGLGHNIDLSSVMNADLNSGTSKRAMNEADLNIPDADGGGDPLYAAGFHREHKTSNSSEMPIIGRNPVGSKVSRAITQSQLARSIDRLNSAPFTPPTGMDDINIRGVDRLWFDFGQRDSNWIGGTATLWTPNFHQKKPAIPLKGAIASLVTSLGAFNTGGRFDAGRVHILNTQFTLSDESAPSVDSPRGE